MNSANRVAKHLWIGSAPDPERSDMNQFDVLVLCAREYQPRAAFRGTMVIHVPLDDSGVPMLPEEKHGARVAADEVAKALHRGQRVLVTCAQGRNRSGLVAALALRKFGYKPIQAIVAVRKARGQHALSNPYFVEFLQKS